MSAPNYRRERIERLLEELRYEITRGMLDREVDERLAFSFIVPVSCHIREGIVLCEFRTQPTARYNCPTNAVAPRLRVIK